MPGRNSFAPLESSSTATIPAVFRRRRPPNDARMSTAIVVLPPPPDSSIHPHHPHPSSSSSSLFLSLPLTQAKGIFVSTVGSRGGGGVSLRDSAEQTQERVKFPDFPRKFPPINWFTSNVYPRGQRTPPFRSCFVVSSCKFVESSPAFRTISRTKLLTHKLVQGKRKRDGFLKGRKCFERRF